MKVRYIDHPERTGWASEFNVHSMDEVILYFDDGDATSETIGLLEVFLEKPLESSVYRPDVWIPMSSAFKSHDLITDNYNTRFCEPKNEDDKKKGWY